MTLSMRSGKTRAVSPDECRLSDCRRYRYTWDLVLDHMLGVCVFIGLNPSTADEQGPDPTVRRCINYAERWGHGRLIMLNLFAFRATDPKRMKIAPDPVGPDNNRTLIETARLAIQSGGVVVAAWGAHGAHMNRAAMVRRILSPFPLHYLTLTKGGEPGHPLYLKGDLMPQRWQ